MDTESNPAESIKTTKSVLHWHAVSVLSLCFTPEGSYLLSGGHECVLVKWMYKTGQKDFKPRLGAPINELVCSKDNTLYATQHSDNSNYIEIGWLKWQIFYLKKINFNLAIHLIGTNFNVIQTFSGFLCPNFSNRPKHIDTFYPTGLEYFSHLNSLITNGKPGHLQFYSYNNDKLLFNVIKLVWLNGRLFQFFYP